MHRKKKTKTRKKLEGEGQLIGTLAVNKLFLKVRSGVCESIMYAWGHIMTRDKTFTMLGEVGMANKSTKTIQTSVRMAQHNERTRLHDLSCTPYQPIRALVMPTLFVHCVEPSAH